MIANTKLKCVILCSSLVFRKWQAESLRLMLKTNLVEIVLFVCEDKETQEETFLQKIVSYLKQNIIYKLYTRFFVRFRSLETEDMSNDFQKVDFIKCKTIKKGKYSEYFRDEDIAKIKSFQPDFIIRFGYNIIKGEILNIAKYGVWSYHHSDEKYYRGGPPAFWEIFRNDPITGAILQKLNEKIDGGVVLKKGYFKTINHSWRETFDTIYFESSRWLAQVCIDISIGNSSYFDNAASSSSAKMNTYPNNIEACRFILKLLKNKIIFHFNDLFKAEKWTIAYSPQTYSSLIKTGLKDYQILPLECKQKEEYFADPSGFYYNKKYHIIAEYYSYKNKKASLVHFSYPSLFEGCENKIEISNNSHLSFPYIFFYQGKVFMMPESSNANSVWLYEYDGKQFVQKHCIINEPLVDAVLFHYNSKWWIMATRKDSLTNVNLFIYHSKDLLGEYTPHINNPVKSDIRSTRSAGTPFIINNILYRPAQNCSKTYGGSIVINRINTLSEDKFVEENIAEIFSPDKSFNKGIHTLNPFEENLIFDMKKYVFSFNNFKNKLALKLRIH